jgi:demethylmenaquinone methyltransferase/2-methoxy-6-polyprenyl-1,4-benzoquinol methylase
VRQGLLAKRAAEIRGMFGRISPRYDLLNRMLSLGQDATWRRRVARRVAELAPRTVVDVCTGTAELAMAMADGAVVYGSDFCIPMLIQARAKIDRGQRQPRLIAADALCMPLSDDTADVATVAFGIRNFEDLEAGLAELVRVLRPGGALLILEFSRPGGLLGPLLGWWIRHVPPRIGRLISGDPEAYSYLSSSVATFPDGDELCGVLKRVGVLPTAARRLSGGVATLYEAVKMSAEVPKEE